MNPSPYLPGIDVSHFQGAIDWARVKAAGIAFAFIKATDGTSFIDPQLDWNAMECGRVGIPFGLYHFFRPTVDPKEQAQAFLTETKRYRSTLPPALDLELGPVTTPQAAAWLDVVDEALGREPLIYTAPSFAAEFLATGGMGVYPLWIAEYTTKPYPTLPNAWSTWDFWQHSPSGHVDGVPNLVDLDWFHGSDEYLKTWIK
jgi:lysozyme